MLSFVVQNLLTNPFLLKTTRYKIFVYFSSTQLLFIFTKLNLNKHLISFYVNKDIYFLTQIFNQNFTRFFWKKFKPVFTLKFGTVISNMLKSSYFLIYYNLLLHFQVTNTQYISPLRKIIPPVYLYPHTLIPFNFQFTTYNKLMFFIITILVSFYTPTKLNFDLYYRYIWRSPNLLLYKFLNQFYFRLKNY